MARLVTAFAMLVALVAAPAPAHADDETPAPATIEDYASYQPQTVCHPKPRKGTRVLGEYLVAIDSVTGPGPAARLRGRPLRLRRAGQPGERPEPRRRQRLSS